MPRAEELMEKAKGKKLFYRPAGKRKGMYTPTQIICVSFVIVIALGTFLLSLPVAIMKKQTDKTLEFVYEIDPSIIGGFILRVDSMQLDASVNSELKKLRLKLLNSK